MRPYTHTHKHTRAGGTIIIYYLDDQYRLSAIDFQYYYLEIVHNRIKNSIILSSDTDIESIRG